MSVDPHTSVQVMHQLGMLHSSLPDLLSSSAHMGMTGHEGQVDWTSLDLAATPICPKFGEPGWAPLCFLNGNPVFNAFDKFQAFMEGTLSSFANLVGSAGVENPYGPSIILFTFFIRLLLFPLTYKQLEVGQTQKALTPKMAEIREKFPDDKNMQAQLIGSMYDQADSNPLAGCLPALIQAPITFALYRSFLDLAMKNDMSEPFLWIPNLSGPVFGERSSDWLLNTDTWVNGVPKLGWHDTLAYLSITVLTTGAQIISFKLLSPPPSEGEEVPESTKRIQRLIEYLPFLFGYFCLSLPSGLQVYYLSASVFATATSLALKEYFKANPLAAGDINIDELAAQFSSAYYNPMWGYLTKSQIVEEARINEKPDRSPIIPPDFA